MYFGIIQLLYHVNALVNKHLYVSDMQQTNHKRDLVVQFDIIAIELASMYPRGFSLVVDPKCMVWGHSPMQPCALTNF